MESSEKIQELIDIAEAFFTAGDLKSAYDNYRDAAIKGSGDAAYRLGEFFEKGLYVKCNIKAAKQWYFTAATKGNKQAKERLDKGLPKDYPKEDDEPKNEDFVEPETYAATGDKSPSLGEKTTITLEKPAATLEGLVARGDELLTKLDNPEESLKPTPTNYETRELPTEVESTTNDKENKEVSASVKEELVQQEMSNDDAGAETNEVQIETKENLRWLAFMEFIKGIALIILGAVFTAMSSKKVFIGAIVVGCFYLLRAIYHLFKSFFKNDSVENNTPAKSHDRSGSSGGHKYVDLGLPSGTLWSVTNVGADSPENFGDFFAWGETTPKTKYSWSNYKHGNGRDCDVSKKYNTTDNKTTLERSDDAAYQNWGSDWRMPTQAQFQELKDNCKWTWTTRNDVHGYEVKGPNDNTIFLPAAGFNLGTGHGSYGSSGNYWSSTLYTDYPIYGRVLWFNSSEVLPDNCCNRYCGQSVRPVRCR